jgi:lipoprotein NlpI
MKEKQEDYPKSMEILKKILAIDSNFSPAYNAMGMIYDKMEDYNSAYNQFTKAIELDSNNAVFYHNRGCCLKNMGRYE